MAFKGPKGLATLGSKLGSALLRTPSPRVWLKAPLRQGVALALILAAGTYGWLTFESRDTLKELETATPPAVASLEPQPVAAPPAAADASAHKAGPIADLIDHTQAGDLPRIGTDGTQAWRAYAVPAAPSDKPRVAILVTGLGISPPTDDTAIHALPGAIDLGFLTFSERIRALAGQARASGHEVILAAPMEPEGYPNNDPGPQALLVKSSAAENVARLDWHLARADSYVGVAPAMGSSFTASPEPLRPILSELAKRGLLYVDTGAAVFGAAPTLAKTIGIPIAIADRTIDRVPTKAAIDRELADLETLARRRGWAFGVAGAYPSTLDRLAAWSAGLEAKGIALVPVTAIAQAPTPQSAQPEGAAVQMPAVSMPGPSKIAHGGS
ncbi:MAG TPA: divergent polysaccharide deacetylase family protein [Alphaproteobacteria bacterium]|nr:divergent polysaccharide deacetylase family protein [Alphaproteobacteria bacterium]